MVGQRLLRFIKKKNKIKGGLRYYINKNNTMSIDKKSALKYWKNIWKKIK